MSWALNFLLLYCNEHIVNPILNVSFLVIVFVTFKKFPILSRPLIRGGNSLLIRGFPLLFFCQRFFLIIMFNFLLFLLVPCLFLGHHSHPCLIRNLVPLDNLLLLYICFCFRKILSVDCKTICSKYQLDLIYTMFPGFVKLTSVDLGI